MKKPSLIPEIGCCVRDGVTRYSRRAFKGTIYYFGAFSFPAKNASTQRVRSNAKAFRDLGYRVILVGMHDGVGRSVERRNSFVHDGFHCLSICVGNSALTKALRRLIASTLFQILNMRFRSPAVICYNYLSFPQAQIQLFCRIKRIPFSPDVTEWYGPSGQFFSDLVRRLDTTIRMRILNRLADGIITTSPYLTMFYRSSKRPLVELPTLFDRDETGVGTAKGGAPISLVFAGNPFNPRLDRLKPAYWKERLDWIIEVVAEANRGGLHAKLDIFGVTKERYLSNFTLMTEEHNDDWLMFWGQVPRSRVLEATRRADFTIFFREPTRANKAGFPSKFAESITCGTPVITNPIENIEPLARDNYNCVFMDPSKLIECGEKLRHLSLHYGEAVRMKKYCADNQVFDYRSWINQVAEFCESWLKR